jgi:CheY-like chemotaxis protein
LTRKNERDSLARGVEDPDIPTVLVVDDEPDVLSATVELFEALGYRALCARCGGEALEILARTPSLKVLYTDVLMPKMSGVTLARRARDLIPNIKVLLVSGSPDTVADLHGGEPHEFDLLMKPVLPSEVALALGDRFV